MSWLRTLCHWLTSLPVGQFKRKATPRTAYQVRASESSSLRLRPGRQVHVPADSLDAAEPIEEPVLTDATCDHDYLVALNDDLVWPEHVDSVDSAFSRGDFFAVGTKQAKPRLDQRRQDALEQSLDLRAGQQQDWRQSPFGAVVQTPGGREALVLQQPVRRPSAEASLRTLVERQGQVRDKLGKATDRIRLQWPSEVVVGFDGGIEGYFTDSMDQSFVTEADRSRPTIRTLPFAFGVDRRRKGMISSDDRLDLVRLVAQWVGALHEAGVVHGSINATSIAFSVDPICIAPLDYATARVEGNGSWLSQSAVANDATLPAETQLDDDRRAFAQIANNLLVPSGRGDLTRSVAVPKTINGLDPRTVNRLHELWARAAGRPGTMPTLEEWLRVLGVEAQPVSLAEGVSPG